MTQPSSDRGSAPNSVADRGSPAASGLVLSRTILPHRLSRSDREREAKVWTWSDAEAWDWFGAQADRNGGDNQ